MGKEDEQSILTSSGLDNEIRELYEARDFARTMVAESPKGSCDHRLFKSQLRGIDSRLTELGVDEIEESVKMIK